MLVIVVIRQWAGYLSGISGFGSWQGHRFFPVPQYPHLGGATQLVISGYLKASFHYPRQGGCKGKCAHIAVRLAEPCVWGRHLQQIFVCMQAICSVQKLKNE